MRILLSLLLCSAGCVLLFPKTTKEERAQAKDARASGVNPDLVGEYNPWNPDRPGTGRYPDPSQVSASLTNSGSWKQTTSDLHITPHDSTATASQGFVLKTQLTDVFLDRDASAEKLITIETQSGEFFVTGFAAADDGKWVHIGTFPLPSIAKDPKCRAAGDGIFRLQGANMVKGAPQFFWVEVQASDLCSTVTYTERSLHLFALIGGELRPILETTVTHDQFTKVGHLRAGEQISYTVELDKKSGLKLSGPREVYPEAGAATGEQTRTEIWYYFNGQTYEKKQ